MAWQPSDPRAPLSKQDMICRGVDACRHPFLGIVISQSAGDPEQQGRDFLISLRQATASNIAGRDRNNDLSQAEFEDWLRQLEWHRNNSIVFPPPAQSFGHYPVEK